MMKPSFAIVAALLWTSAAVAGRDEDAVRDLLHTTFDKPEVRLVVDPVVVTNGYSIAGWTQGWMGGRALLQHRQGRWVLILCAGDGIRSPESLRQIGLAASVAHSLSEKLAEAERLTTSERVAMFGRFEGLIKIDEAGDHPSASHHR